MKHTKHPIRGILACLLVILIFVFIFPSDAQAATQGNYTYTTANGAATITKCSTSASGKITLPNTLGGYPVTAIGASAFSGCTRLTEVIIPAGVTSIGGSESHYADLGLDRHLSGRGYYHRCHRARKDCNRSIIGCYIPGDTYIFMFG